MKNISVLPICMLLAVLLIGTAYAKFSKPGEAIQYRKAVMVLIQQHFKEMGAVVKGKSDYDPASFSADAAVVKMLATLPWEAFLTPGSDKGKTSMSSSVFKKQAQFTELANDFEAATAELAAAAQNGEIKAIKGQFGKVAQVCGSCHKNFQK
jgi:cytochrome c556